MRAQFFDGRTTRPRQVELTLQNGRLLGTGETGEALDWPAGEISVTPVSEGRLRLTAHRRDEKLTVDAEAWRAFAGGALAAGGAAARKREWRLVGALTAGALCFAAVIFVGIPAASGPLARMTSPAFEARIGHNMEAQMTLALRPCQDRPRAQAQLDALGNMLAENADTPFEIRFTAVRAPMVNAFTLPGGRILVTDRLIAEAGGPDELAGVLAHEIGHVEHRDVMQSVWRSMGVGLLLDAAVGGGTGAGQQAILLAGGVTNQRFSRELEGKADDRAVEILQAHDISTAGMADFFDRLADKRSSRAAKDVAEWFATHPDTERRAAKVRATIRPGRPALSAQGWRELQTICRKG